MNIYIWRIKTSTQNLACSHVSCNYQNTAIPVKHSQPQPIHPLAKNNNKKRKKRKKKKREREREREQANSLKHKSI